MLIEKIVKNYWLSGVNIHTSDQNFVYKQAVLVVNGRSNKNEEVFGCICCAELFGAVD